MTNLQDLILFVCNVPNGRFSSVQIFLQTKLFVSYPFSKDMAKVSFKAENTGV